MSAKTDELEFVLVRMFDAPRELVFKAWTDAKHLAKWWGPKGFTNPVCKVDARPGGAWYASMTSPEGVDHPCHGVFKEIEPPERLVLTIDVEEKQAEEWRKEIGERVGELLYTVTFEEQGGKTKMTARTRFPSARVRDYMLKMGMQEGWSQSLDKMGQLWGGS